MDELLKELKARGFDFNPVFDDTMHRFRRGTKNPNAFFKGSKITVLGKTILKACYGDWRTEEKYFWRSDKESNYSPEESAAIEKALKEHQEKEERENAYLQQKAKEEAQKIYGEAIAGMTHPYLKRKKIEGGIFHKVGLKGDLIIPIFNNNEIVSIQTIKENGEKSFLKNGKLKGSYGWYTNEVLPQEIDVLYIAEGYATAGSISLAMNAPVLVSFTANKLKELCKNLPIKAKKVIVCADSDQWTENNPGLTNAKEAMQILHWNRIQADVRHPIFPKNGPKLTDFNDLHVTKGIDAVRETIEGTYTETLHEDQKEERTEGSGVFEIAPLEKIEAIPVEFSKGKVPKPILPTQERVAMALYDLIGNSLMREGKEVFHWRGTHWKELDPVNFKAYVRRATQRLMNGFAKDKDMNAYYNIFMDCLKTVPEGQSFYIQMPTLCNFLDGTLEILEKDGKYALNFREHNRLDLLTWALPYEYKAPRPPNKLFAHWVNQIFLDDDDAMGKIRAMKQIGGACLISSFPRLAFLYGAAKTGKSTFAKLCMAFVGKDNYSSVEPENMRDFHLEGMINKQINVVTELSGFTIDKGFFKRFEDGLMFQVNRKGRQVVKARLPNVHVYCTNDLPSGIDGRSKAMDRRVTILEFKNEIEETTMARAYELTLLRAGPGAILQFFLEGLEDLCESGGFYFNPESGQEHMKEWKLENDPVGQFLRSIEKGEVETLKGDVLYLQHDAKIKQMDLAEAYFSWASRSGVRHHMTRHKLYKEMRQKGYQTKTVEGYDCFRGIGSGVREKFGTMAP